MPSISLLQFELTYFVDACHLVDVKEQYRWYQVLYRSGDFIGRSTISLFKVRQFWLLPTLQVTICDTTRMKHIMSAMSESMQCTQIY